MKVLVTGGAGFIGSNLIRHLAAAGSYDILVLDDLSANPNAPPLPPQARLVVGDFTDRQTVAECLSGVDAVVHLAALSGVMDSIQDPRPSFEINVVGSFQLLDLARKAGVQRIICASTGGAILGEVMPPITEDMAPSPLSPYGASKLALEGYCSAFAGAYGLSSVALRFSNIYGPQSSHKKSVVATFIKRAIQGKPLVVYGDGSQQRDYLYVGDLVRGIEAAMTRDLAGAYQLGSGRPTSLRQLIAALREVANREITVEFEPARRGEIHATWCNTAKAGRDLGFMAPTDLAAGLRTTWQWFLQHQDAWTRETLLTSAD